MLLQLMNYFSNFLLSIWCFLCLLDIEVPTQFSLRIISELKLWHRYYSTTSNRKNSGKVGGKFLNLIPSVSSYKKGRRYCNFIVFKNTTSYLFRQFLVIEQPAYNLINCNGGTGLHTSRERGEESVVPANYFFGRRPNRERRDESPLRQQSICIYRYYVLCRKWKAKAHSTPEIEK